MGKLQCPSTVPTRWHRQGHARLRVMWWLSLALVAVSLAVPSTAQVIDLTNDPNFEHALVRAFEPQEQVRHRDSSSAAMTASQTALPLTATVECLSVLPAGCSVDSTVLRHYSQCDTRAAAVHCGQQCESSQCHLWSSTCVCSGCIRLCSVRHRFWMAQQRAIDNKRLTSVSPPPLSLSQ